MFSKDDEIDSEETSALIVKMTTILTLISVDIVHQWLLFQLDARKVFLYEFLSEEVYTCPPLGFSHPFWLVCHFRHALYGLKQSPRAV